MSGFVSVPDSGIREEFLQTDVRDTLEREEAEVRHVDFGGFWPAIAYHDARGALRLGTVITDIRLRDALRAAGAAVLRDLRAWRDARQAAGATTLAEVDADAIDGRNVLELHFERAVTNHAAALLFESHRDVTATDRGADRAEEKACSADDYRRVALHAIRDILDTARAAGQPSVGRTAVELI